MREPLDSSTSSQATQPMIAFHSPRGEFAVYRNPDAERAPFLLVRTKEEAKILRGYGNPLDAIHDVLARTTGHPAWDRQPTESLPEEIYDLSRWVGPEQAGN